MDGEEYRRYIEDKYKGQTVIGPYQNQMLVRDICDLRWEHLELQDQKLALDKNVQWGWAMGDGDTIEDSTHLKGFLFRPTNRDVWLCPDRYVCVIGAWGSSKTFIANLKTIDTCIKWPGTQALIMRTTYTQLLDTTIDSMFKIFNALDWKEGQHYVHRITDREVHILLDKGKKSVIKYRPGKEEGKTFEEITADLKGLEPDCIFLDEADQLLYEYFLILTGRLGRGIAVMDETRRQLLAMANPPDSDNWIVDHWLRHRHHNEEQTPLTDHQEYMFFNADAEENRANLDPKYIEALRNLPPSERLRYYQGRISYIPPSGIRVYENFNAERHIMKDWIAPIKGEPIYRGFDGGPTDKNKAMVCGQLSRDRQTLFIMDEFLFDGAGIDRFGQLCMERCMQKFGSDVQYLDFGDPKLMDKIKVLETDQRSAADILKKYGINIRPGDANFDIRKNAVDVFLSREWKGYPCFFIYAGCRELIRGFRGNYRYQILDPKEKTLSGMPIKNKWSHYHDALQYLCTKITARITSIDRKKKWEAIKNMNPKAYRIDKYDPRGIRKLKRKHTTITH